MDFIKKNAILLIVLAAGILFYYKNQKNFKEKIMGLIPTVPGPSHNPVPAVRPPDPSPAPPLGDPIGFGIPPEAEFVVVEEQVMPPEPIKPPVPRPTKPPVRVEPVRDQARPMHREEKKQVSFARRTRSVYER